MKSVATIPVLLALALSVTVASPQTSPSSNLLTQYVSRPDSSYAWSVQRRFERRGAQILELRLHSQTWRGVLWKHQLYVIRPEALEQDRQGVLIIDGGRWRERYDREGGSPFPDDVKLYERIARYLGAVIAVLKQVPFQPLFDRVEDDLIAYTFDEYLSSGDADWPLLLPMVKSASSAMTAIQALSEREWGFDLDHFTVLGGSKRGWTSWLTGAADPRATALIPAVIDVLNFAAHFPYQTQVWGGPSAQIEPYTSRGLHDVLASDAGRRLREIVDPFTYRSSLTQPKLIIIGTNDPYFPVDALNLYWDALRGPKYVLYLPNEAHDVLDLRRIIRSTRALHRHVALGAPLPQLAWEHEVGDAEFRLCVHSDIEPRRVRAWTAESVDGDFRGALWSSERLRKRDGTYTYRRAAPQSGYAAVFVESTFGRGRSSYYLSTTLNVVASRSASGRTKPAGNREVCPERL